MSERLHPHAKIHVRNRNWKERVSRINLWIAPSRKSQPLLLALESTGSRERIVLSLDRRQSKDHDATSTGSADFQWQLASVCDDPAMVLIVGVGDVSSFSCRRRDLPGGTLRFRV